MSQGAVHKGAGIRSWAQFLDQRFGAGTMDGLVAELPAELRSIWPDVLASGWYPARFAGAVWEGAVRKHIGPSRRAQQETFGALGRFAAEDNLTTIYRFLLSVMSPDRLLGMMPRLWGTYFEGIEIDVESLGPQEGRVAVRGLGEVPYLGPTAVGWLMFAYEKCGARTIDVTEAGWEAGRIASDTLVFTQRWS